jgi:hypothetical protein
MPAPTRRYLLWAVLGAGVIAAALGIRALTREPGNVPATTAEAPPPAPETERDVRTAFYNLTLKVHLGMAPPPDRPRAGGSLAALRDGFLLVTAAGEFYRVTWNGDALRSERLPLVLPFHRQALIAESGAGAGSPFRITDLLVDDRDGTTTIYVAHHHWTPETRCVSLRISSTVLSGAAAAEGNWTPVYDSEPCLQVGPQWPMGEQADRSGGRLARHPLGLLLTVGDHGYDGLEDVPVFPQDQAVSYGKVMLIAPGGEASVFSAGHRNAQGLAIDTENRVWSTEHGPEGGDELNLVIRGGNYGWPRATYGTAYDGSAWPLSVNPRDHGEYVEPAVAFVPAIGVSQLMQIQGNYFPRWKGDLMVSSLQAGTLFRMRTVGGRVIYTEPIELSVRIRDIAEGQDGRILLWTDGGDIATLTHAQ